MVLCEASAIIICEWGGLVRHTCAVVCLSFALVVRRANKIWQTDWQRICVWSYGAWRRFTVPASLKEFKFIVNDMSLSKQRIPQSTDGTPKHSFRVSVCLFDSVRIWGCEEWKSTPTPLHPSPQTLHRLASLCCNLYPPAHPHTRSSFVAPALSDCLCEPIERTELHISIFILHAIITHKGEISAHGFWLLCWRPANPFAFAQLSGLRIRKIQNLL